MAKVKVIKIDLLEPVLVRTFGLERVYENTLLLNDWLSAKGELNDFEMTYHDFEKNERINSYYIDVDSRKSESC